MALFLNLLGFILGIIYILAVGNTALLFVEERKDGLLERSFVAGAKSYHLLAAHVTIQTLIIFVQAVIVLFFAFVVFRISIQGQVGWIILLLVLQGLVGMSFGKWLDSVAI